MCSKKGIQPDFDLRVVLRADDDCGCWFGAVKPRFCPIPDDGPVGKRLDQLGRHPCRPVHLHYIVSADGYEKLTTHIFDPDDESIGSDAVFGVKESLLAAFRRVHHPARAERLEFSGDFREVECNLAPSPVARFHAATCHGKAARQGRASSMRILDRNRRHITSLQQLRRPVVWPGPPKAGRQIGRNHARHPENAPLFPRSG